MLQCSLKQQNLQRNTPVYSSQVTITNSNTKGCKHDDIAIINNINIIEIMLITKQEWYVRNLKHS